MLKAKQFVKDENWSKPAVLLRKEKALPLDLFPKRLQPKWFDDDKVPCAGYQLLPPQAWLQHLQKCVPDMTRSSMEFWDQFAYDIQACQLPSWLQPEIDPLNHSQLQRLLQFCKGAGSRTGKVSEALDSTIAAASPAEEMTFDESMQLLQRTSSHIPYREPYTGPIKKKSNSSIPGQTLARGAAMAVSETPYLHPQVGDIVLVRIDIDADDTGFVEYNPDNLPEPALVVGVQDEELDTDYVKVSKNASITKHYNRLYSVCDSLSLNSFLVYFAVLQ